MKRVTVAPIVLVAGLAMLAVPARAQDVKEPRTGVSFPVKQDGMTLLGVGVRTKTFLKVKVYAAGFYVADAALAGPLAVHRGRTGTPPFYRDLAWGDFPKAIVMKFVRDTTAAQIRDAFYEALPGVDRDAWTCSPPTSARRATARRSWCAGDRAASSRRPPPARSSRPSRTRPSPPRCSASGSGRNPSRKTSSATSSRERRRSSPDSVPLSLNASPHPEKGGQG